MKERPILMSAPMVNAILDGRKTQTRRFVKSVGGDDGFVLLDHGNGYWPYRSDDGESSFHTVTRGGKEYLDETPHACPYGQPGDRLWVRETFSDVYGPNGDEKRRKREVMYRANGETDPYVIGGRWTPSIYMPRWASRIDIEVVSVRVEHLQDISHADAMAEGMALDDAVYDYSRLWESLNGTGSWAANPWVWVVEFRRIKP